MNLKEMQDRLPSLLFSLQERSSNIDIKSIQFTSHFIVVTCETQIWTYDFETEEWE